MCVHGLAIHIPTYKMQYKHYTNQSNMLKDFYNVIVVSFEAALNFALRSQDPLFHFTLYLWLICSNLKDRLVQVESPYVEEFLQQSISDDLQVGMVTESVCV